MSVAVLIVDLASSVAKPSRLALNRALEGIRAAAPEALAQAAWGDEVEAVLPYPVNLWDLYIRVCRHMEPIGFYMGVGWGELTEEPIPGETSIHELNGTAFKAARAALDDSKNRGSDLLTLRFCAWEHPSLGRALNGSLDMMNAAFRAMTTRQRLYVADRTLGLRPGEIARRHGVTSQTVTTVLQKAGAAQIAIMQDQLDALTHILTDILSWGREGAPAP